MAMTWMEIEYPAIGLVVMTFVLLLLAIGTVQILQRRLLHPLCAVPGPWLNSVSELPAALALIRGEQHIYYSELHEKYGSVVRVSPNELSFISTEAREEIYGLRKNGLNMEKSPIFLGAVRKVEGQTGVSLALNEEHARQRRALGYVFMNSALLQQEKLIRLHIEKMMGVFKYAASECNPVDFSSWLTYLAFDIMGELCFAEPFGCLEQASSTEWSTSVINVFIAATWTQVIRRLTGVGTLLERIALKLFVPAEAARWRATHLNNSKEKTVRRLADEERNHPDFLYQILRHESKKSLSTTEIVLNLALFISAGTDTTATALTGWTYYLCTHPHVFERVASEVRRSFSSQDEIKWEAVKELKYLEATINEALRLFPPSAASQQRIVPRGGALIDGYNVPEGYTVAVSPWASTRSRLNFVEPERLVPERWLNSEEYFSKDKLNASLPFGTGPRVCIGRNLAYMEMRLILAYLVWNFDMELDCDDHRAANEVWGMGGEMKPMKVFHSMTKPDLWVRLREAQGSQ